MKTNPYIDRAQYAKALRDMGYHGRYPGRLRRSAGPLPQAAAALALTTILLIASLLTVGTTSWVLLGLTLAAFAWAVACAGVILHRRQTPTRRH